MKKNNGFTLVEILVVIAIISAISIITIPSIILINKNLSTRMLEAKKDLFILAAKKYAREHSSLFVTDTITIDLNTLLEEDYISPDEDKKDKCSYEYGCIFNPVDKTLMNELEIEITNNNNIYLAKWKK